MGKVFEHNALLQQQNEVLKQQADAQQKLLDELHTNQQDKLNALAQQIDQQVGGINLP
jgi:ElaB/YqjD/DUF883 family membrane-anchored ribosome-binding protein